MTNTILINSQNLNGLINANLFIEDFNNQLIYISELTDFFGLGYNSFLVDVKQNTFQIGSFLHIFFADKNITPAKNENTIQIIGNNVITDCFPKSADVPTASSRKKYPYPSSPMPSVIKQYC